MELRNIKTFLFVAEQRSFSKAAALLGYSQSTVTAQIQQLEQEFDVLLFERIHKTVRLTQPGQEFLAHAQKLIRSAEEARVALKRLPVGSGELRIAMAESLCTTFFPGILERFHREFPQVELRIVPAGTDEMFGMLRRNEADLVYTLDHRIYSSDLITALEREEDVCFIAAPGYLEDEREYTLAELAGSAFMLTERDMSYRKHLEELLAAKSLEIHAFLELGNVEMLRSLAEKGSGISFLPEYAVRASLTSGKLVKLNVPENTIRVWRQLIYHKNKWMTPQMEAMIRVIKEHEAEEEIVL